MKSLNSTNQQFDLYSDMFAISIDMVQKLAQNNIEYFKNSLTNSLRLIPSSPDVEAQDYLATVQNALTEAIKNNNRLCQDAHTIFSKTSGKISTMVQEQHLDLDYSPISFFFKNFNQNVSRKV